MNRSMKEAQESIDSLADRPQYSVAWTKEKELKTMRLIEVLFKLGKNILSFNR